MIYWKGNERRWLFYVLRLSDESRCIQFSEKVMSVQNKTTLNEGRDFTWTWLCTSWFFRDFFFISWCCLVLVLLGFLNAESYRVYLQVVRCISPTDGLRPDGLYQVAVCVFYYHRTYHTCPWPRVDGGCAGSRAIFCSCNFNNITDTINITITRVASHCLASHKRRPSHHWRRINRS